MTRAGRLGRWALWASLMSSVGCLRFLSPLDLPPACMVECCHELPRACREHVYIFFLSGLDPTDHCNLKGVHDYIRDLGFRQVYYGHVCHVPAFTEEIRRIHATDPDARFVLVGHNTGAKVIRHMAEAARAEGICVDAQFCLRDDALRHRPCPEPCKQSRLVTILSGKTVWWKEDAPDEPEPGVVDLGSACEQETLLALAEVLCAIGGSIPVVEPQPRGPAVPLEEAPTPRPVMPQSAKARDEWDFLKPVSMLRASRAGGSEPQRTPASE